MDLKCVFGFSCSFVLNHFSLPISTKRFTLEMSAEPHRCLRVKCLVFLSSFVLNLNVLTEGNKLPQLKENSRKLTFYAYYFTTNTGVLINKMFISTL